MCPERPGELDERQSEEERVTDHARWHSESGSGLWRSQRSQEPPICPTRHVLAVLGGTLSPQPRRLNKDVKGLFLHELVENEAQCMHKSLRTAMRQPLSDKTGKMSGALTGESRVGVYVFDVRRALAAPHTNGDLWTQCDGPDAFVSALSLNDWTSAQSSRWIKALPVCLRRCSWADLQRDPACSLACQLPVRQKL